MEKVENEDHEKTVIPSEKHYADFAPSAVPVAPDGGIAPGFGLEPPAPVPALSPESCICLRGPCRHYWHMVTTVESGNPVSTWAALGIAAPRQHNRVCLLNQGMETDWTDDCVFECNKWDPALRSDLVQLDARRRAYHDSPEGRALALAQSADQPEEQLPEEQLDEGDDDAGTDDATEG